MDYVDGLEIRGAGGGKDSGSQSRNPVEAPNSLFSVAFAKVLYLLSEGEVEGFPNSDKQDIYLDGTPIETVNKLAPVQKKERRINFQNVTLSYTAGTAIQAPLTGFSQIENTVSVATAVSRNIGPVTRTISDPDVEKVRFIIQHPSLQSINVSTGDTNPTSVTYRISISSNGGNFISINPSGGNYTVSGKSSGQFQRAYEAELPRGGAPWQIRVERITADATSSLLSNQIIWQAYTEIIDEKLAYPNSAVLGVRVDARQFSNIPDVTVRLRGKRVEIPNNYNPTTRAYTGLWNGTFTMAWTDNPAWIFRDLCLNPIYGVRRYLPSFEIDKWSLYQIAQYCDELVPNGLGGTEPRFRCNVYLQNSGGVFEVLNGLASVFRGLLHYTNGQLTLTQDRPGVPVQQFSEANVLQDVDENGNVTSPCFVYQGTSRTARKSVVLASWDDPAQNYNQVTEYLQDDELLSRFGYLPTDLRLLGVTSRGQALRAAKFALFSNRYLIDKVSFRVAAEGLAAGVGEIIQIADPLRQGQRLGGRVKAVSDNTVTLDATLTQQAVTYSLTLVSPSGTTTTRGDGTTTTSPSLDARTVTAWGTSAEGYTTLTVSGNAVNAQVGSLWVLEWQDLHASLYRILTISETAPLVFQIEALPYNESAYGYIDNSLPVAIPTDRFTVRDALPPTDLSAALDYRNGLVRIVADWVAPQVDGIDDPQVREYRYQYRQYDPTDSNDTWSDIQRTDYTDAEARLPQFSAGMVFDFRVASVNRLGQKSNWVEVRVADLSVVPNLADPAYGATVTHQNQPDGSQLILISSGTTPLPERIRGYAIWAKPINPDGPIPGVQTPDAAGWYLLSSDVALSGYYTISFHLPADYDLRVAFRSFIPGEEPSDYLTHTIYRDEIAPPAPINFTVVESQDSRMKRFSWRLPLSNRGGWASGIVSDIAGYRIRYRNGGLGGLTALQAWDLGIDLYSAGVPATQTWFDTALFDSDEWTVMIRSTDMTGWMSDEVTTVQLSTSDPLVQNVVQSGSLDVTTATSLVNCQIVTPQGGTSYIEQIDPTKPASFFWTLDNNNILSSLRLSTTAAATYQHYLGALAGEDIVILQENDDEIWQENDQTILAEQLDYSGAMSSQAAGTLHPYAPLEQLTEDLYAVRTTLVSLDGTTAATLTAVSYELDYPDLLEAFNGQQTNAQGTITLNLTKPFHAVTAAQVTIYGDGSGAVSAVVTSKSTTAVSIKTLNAAGTAVSGTIDVTVQGY